MKVYTVWHHESHEGDALTGIYATEELAVIAAEILAKTVFTHGDWMTPKKHTNPPGSSLHAWGAKDDVENDDTWTVVTVEEDDVIGP